MRDREHPPSVPFGVEDVSRFEPAFFALRESILRNLLALQRGDGAIRQPYRLYPWDERRFWDRLAAEVHAGSFKGFLRRSRTNQLPEFCALLQPHVESGRFDHVIRAWARWSPS